MVNNKNTFCAEFNIGLALVVVGQSMTKSFGATSTEGMVLLLGN
jgi:hypothetical protein